MIGMQMSTQDIINFFRLYPGCGQIFQIGKLLHMIGGQTRHVSVVTNASIDQNGMLRRAHQPAVHADHQSPRLWIEMIGRKPVHMWRYQIRIIVR